VTHFYDIDDANAALPDLRDIVATLAGQRADLVRLRDEVLAAHPDPDVEPAGSSPLTPTEPTPAAVAADELRLARLRMQGLIDQMAAGVARIEAMGITLRDIPDGLVDFPALVNGRPIWLCWKLGESEVGFWHDLESGFGGRQPLSELV
jgi:hypothetical protein